MKNNKGFSAIAIVIILAIIASGGYAVWRKQSPAPAPTSSPDTNIEPPAPSPSTSSVDTSNPSNANWKTYKDEQHGFEVKYPVNYVFRKIGGIVTFADVSNIPITLVGPLLGSENVNDLALAVHVLNIFGKTGNSDPTIFAQNNMSSSPELDYLNPDLALKFKANRAESVRSLPSGNYQGYIFQKNNEVYILYSLDTNTILLGMISTFRFVK